MPGTRKKIMKWANEMLDKFWNQDLLRRSKVQKIAKKYLHITIAMAKVSLFIWDTVKDFFLWYILYTKKEFISSQLLWLFFTSIFLAQSLLGIYLTRHRAMLIYIPDTTNTLVRGLILFSLILLTPFLPGIVLFKAAFPRVRISNLPET